MAESVNAHKLSTTSDLGSSCCDIDTDLSSDAKDQSDDVISVAGSTSLTMDSLEEEDLKEQRFSELPITSILQSEMLKISSDKDSPSLHKHPSTEGSKDKHKASELIVTRNIAASDTNTPENRGADKQDTKCGNESEKRVRQAEEKQTTSEVVHEQTESKLSSMNPKGSGTISTEPPEPNSSKTEPTSSCAKSDDPHNVSETPDEKISLQKSQSLSEETSTDPSPKPSRRSGIPRRKNSTSSMVTVVSGRSTPQSISSPRLGRSMTLDSAGDHHPALWEGPGTPVSTPRSFPTTPIKAVSRLQRSASQCECSSFAGVPCPPIALSKDNISSRLRFEKHHQDHGGPLHVECTGGASSYLTPSQRRDMAVRELRIQVRDLTRQLADRDRQILQLQNELRDNKTDQELKEALETARSSAEASRREVTALQESHTESVKKAALLQQQVDDLKKDMRNKLAESEDIFLEMYNKGRQSAIFEHEEEMEVQRKGGRSQESTEKELYTKLVKAQAELAKWQTIQRHESYTTMPIPGTEAETTLRFLKDSVFHYLTTDKASSDEHLRAIVRILHFSEGQRDKIAHAIILRRNKSGW